MITPIPTPNDTFAISHFTKFTNIVFSVSSALCLGCTIYSFIKTFFTSKRDKSFMLALFYLSSLTSMVFLLASYDIGLIIGNEKFKNRYILWFRDEQCCHIILALLCMPVTIHIQNVVTGIKTRTGDILLLTVIFSNLFSLTGLMLPYGIGSIIMFVISSIMILPLLRACFTEYLIAVDNAPANVKKRCYITCCMISFAIFISIPITFKVFRNSISSDSENLFYTILDLLFYIVIPFILLGSSKVRSQLHFREQVSQDEE